jgi:hypothetical protein
MGPQAAFSAGNYIESEGRIEDLNPQTQKLERSEVRNCCLPSRHPVLSERLSPVRRDGHGF